MSLADSRFQSSRERAGLDADDPGIREQLVGVLHEAGAGKLDGRLRDDLGDHGVRHRALCERDERLGRRGVARVDARGVGDRDARHAVQAQPVVRGAGEDGVGGPDVVRQAIGVVVRRSDQHALEQLVLGERAAHGHLERRLVVAAVLPVRGHVPAREAVLGALLAHRERHLARAPAAP